MAARLPETVLNFKVTTPAGPRPELLLLTVDPDLCLMVDSERIDATSRHGTAHIFCFRVGPLAFAYPLVPARPLTWVWRAIRACSA
jgi:hypothetical protein